MSARALAEALAEARSGGEAFALTVSQREDLFVLTSLWNADRKRRGLASNMTARCALSRVLAGFREDLEQIEKDER